MIEREVAFTLKVHLSVDSSNRKNYSPIIWIFEINKQNVKKKHYMQYIHTCLSLEWTAHLKLKVRFPDKVLTNSWKVMAESPICWWASNLSLRIISFPGEICVINSRLSRASSKSAKGISPNPSGSNRSKSVRHSSLIGGSANSWSGCSSSVYILLKSSS